MEENERPKFAPGIIKQELPSGKVHFQVIMENQGIPEEYVLVLVRNWLKASEQVYYDKFRHDPSYLRTPTHFISL
jgi:hypothetical protein